MILASAQTQPLYKTVNENLEDHYRLVNMAAEHGAQLIVFPEMSVTGYQREKAEMLAFTKRDLRFEKLRHLAADKKIIIIVGAPVKLKERLYIGAFILFPDSSEALYTKRFLHTGEEKYYTPGPDNNPPIQIGNEKISIAVCVEITNPQHPKEAAVRYTTLYIASIYFSPGGMADAHKLLGHYSKNYGMMVLMSNYCGKTWELEAGGKSAFWDNEGNLAGQLSPDKPGLLIVNKTAEGWKTKSIEL